MHFFIYGPSGSGKTTVGKRLARALDLPFVDLDAEIEKESGCCIAEFMAAEGEPAFRDLESAKLNACVERPAKVIALGGGALLRNQNFQIARSHGQIIFLEVDPAALTKRLANDAVKRPLLDGAFEKKLKLLLEARQSHYAAFSLRVNAAQSPQKVVADIQRLLGRFHLKQGCGYDVLVRKNGLSDLGELLNSRDFAGRVMVVSDSNVGPLCAGQALKSLREAGFTAESMLIPAGEAHKNLATISSLWQAFLDAGLDRKSLIIALGGGVVSDLTGFTAATFMRGCRWVTVPTTLLSMVDASIGGKTGFDLPEGKNLIGAFHSPSLVLTDPCLLKSLPTRETRAGLAEVIKHGVIADPTLFSLCARGRDVLDADLTDVIGRAIAVKVDIVNEDPFEQGLRSALNFGHTMGHAVEAASGYAILHGEAVAIGMVAEARLAECMAVAETGIADALEGVLKAHDLPVEIPVGLEYSKIMNAMRTDKKKFNGSVRFSLPVKVGLVKTGIAIKNLESAFQEKK